MYSSDKYNPMYGTINFKCLAWLIIHIHNFVTLYSYLFCYTGEILLLLSSISIESLNKGLSLKKGALSASIRSMQA